MFLQAMPLGVYLLKQKGTVLLIGVSKAQSVVIYSNQAEIIFY